MNQLQNAEPTGEKALWPRCWHSPSTPCKRRTPRPPRSPAPVQPRPLRSPFPGQATHLHLAKPRLVVVAPSQAGGGLSPLQGLLHLLGRQEHLDVHQVLQGGKGRLRGAASAPAKAGHLQALGPQPAPGCPLSTLCSSWHSPPPPPRGSPSAGPRPGAPFRRWLPH